MVLLVAMEKNKPTVDELLARAKKPALLSPGMHKFYEGKMQVIVAAVTGQDTKLQLCLV